MSFIRLPTFLLLAAYSTTVRAADDLSILLEQIKVTRALPSCEIEIDCERFAPHLGNTTYRRTMTALVRERTSRIESRPGQTNPPINANDQTLSDFERVRIAGGFTAYITAFDGQRRTHLDLSTGRMTFSTQRIKGGAETPPFLLPFSFLGSTNREHRATDNFQWHDLWNETTILPEISKLLVPTKTELDGLVEVTIAREEPGDLVRKEPNDQGTAREEPDDEGSYFDVMIVDERIFFSPHAAFSGIHLVDRIDHVPRGAASPTYSLAFTYQAIADKTGNAVPLLKEAIGTHLASQTVILRVRCSVRTTDVPASSIAIDPTLAKDIKDEDTGMMIER